ncbi:MAG: D-glycerate dehydrogenase [Syntrophobacterales bacterium]|jgi:glyoxylate reductase|nr:D-glycerate dehydrogenase [Syntrophobacterales bacterium]
MKPKVFITRQLPDAALEMIRPVCEVEIWPEELPAPRGVLLAKVAVLDGLLSMLTDKIDAELMERAPGLKVISNYAVGVDNIDIPEATRRGIIIGHTPGVLTETTADLAFGLLMAAARRIVEGDRYVRAGQWRTWSPMVLLGRDIHGATLGLVGLGRIGTAVARRAASFGMRVLYHSRTRRPDAEEQLGLIWADLDTVLREADFLSLHTPLTPETRHLINARTLNLMKNTAILVNTSRGGVVDQAALYAALQEGRLAGAALDVTDPEPLPMSDPLLTLPNCVIAPHIGSASIATRTKMAEMAAANLLAGLRGEMPPHPVNPEAWQKG